MSNTSNIAESVIFLEGANILVGEGTTIMDFCVLGMKNPCEDVFDSEEQKTVRIGEKCVINPWSLVYEGAIIEDEVLIGERCMVGSRTRISSGSRLVYGAQVHDNVMVGAFTIVGGFVADNCVIGEKCHVFGALVHRYENRDPHKWDETDEQGPTLEDDVLIGWGAVVVGPVKIAKGAHIKPNSVVTRDVEPGERYGRG